MTKPVDTLKAVREAFWETIDLKLRQLYRVVPKGSNPALTGGFVEELVRAFLREWVSPCLLLHGTLYPHDTNASLPPESRGPKQIDGIVYDPRQGPAILREGSFLVSHPAFCRGVLEIRTSQENILDFERRLQLLYEQYLAKSQPFGSSPYLRHQHVMGVVIHDTDPETRSWPAWLHGEAPIHHYALVGHCPIFILLKKDGEDYFPFEPGIDALIKAIFHSEWQYDHRENKVGDGLLDER